MKLSKILKNIEIIEMSNYADIEIVDVVSDSRDKKDNSIFFAIKGFTIDGAIFSDKVIENGSTCIFYETEILNKNKNKNIVYIKVKNAREVQSYVSVIVYGNTSSEDSLTKIGITGTNGKTSVSYILRHIINNCGTRSKCALLGTTEYDLCGRSIVPTHTTPDSVYLNRHIKEIRDNGCDYIVMEVSSHALMLNRVDNLEFDISVFTNLSQDHFDFHKNMDNYANAKAILFNKLSKEGGFSIINNDDKKSDFFIKNCTNNVRTISLRDNEKSSLKVRNFYYTERGLTIDYLYENENQFTVETNLHGDFQVYNVSSAILTALNLNFEIDSIKISFEKDVIIPGRMESIYFPEKNNLVIIDYAHTPDALENVIDSLNRVKKDKELITIFGCGGDRDKDKRAKMGKISTAKSDFTVITSDNPRNEEPYSIIGNIIEGIEAIEKSNYKIVEDRKDAIIGSINGSKNSIILIAGKGHEDYQEIKGKKYPFSDRIIVEKQLELSQN